MFFYICKINLLAIEINRQNPYFIILKNVTKLNFKTPRHSVRHPILSTASGDVKHLTYKF